MVDLHAARAGTFPGRGKGLLPLQRVDSRVKLVAMVGYIALATGLTSWLSLLVGVAFLGLLIAFSGSGWRRAAARLAWASPLAVAMLLFLPAVTPGHPWHQIRMGPWELTLSLEGYGLAVLLGLRMVNALLAAALLLDTTPWGELMGALRSLRFPALLVQLIDFTLRYIFVTGDELARMNVALKARGFKSGRSLLDRDTFYTLGRVIGTLFIRSWKRSERVYQTMLARGMAGGHVPYTSPTRPGGWDLAWGLGIAGMGLGLRLLEPGGWIWTILSR
ncbi:MAG: cobalt ECF transporter T component CbiQ [Thermoanaerobacteraceae bacterium]|nr:cobalt ECF transporter T component CbiQ [Thermoanaerobacteraceae bacterium]